MASDLTDYADLNPELVAVARARVLGFLGAARRDVDSTAGLVGSLLGEILAAGLAAVDQRVDAYRQSGSLAQAVADPAAFDAATLDALASNFRLSRAAGRQASGRVSLVVRALVPVSVPAGFTFRAGGSTFAASQAFAGRVSQDQVVADSDRLITPTGDGRYSFTVDVTATADGPVGAVVRGTPMIPQAPVVGVVEAYAADDFSGGASEETNAELLARALTGTSGRGPANRVGVTAALTQDATVGPLLSAVSVIGFGDEEQTRYHGLRPIAHGGRADVYVRPTGGPTDVTYELTAVLSEKAGVEDVYALSLSTVEFGGGYSVVQVADGPSPGAAVFEVRAVTRSWQPDEAVDVETATEAVYSSLQTAAVLFAVPPTAAAVGAQRQVYVTVRRAPGVLEAAALLGAAGARPTAGDLLVRAAVPCRVRLSVRIDTPPNRTVDASAVAAAAADVVNDTAFTGHLYASRLTQAVNNTLDSDQSVSEWWLEGSIDSPAGTRLLVSGRSELAVPWRPDVGVTSRTTAFYLSAADVSVTSRGVALS